MSNSGINKMRMVFVAAAAAVVVLVLGGTAHAAVVTWDLVQPITGASDIKSTGVTNLAGADFGITTGTTTIVNNGSVDIEFKSLRSGQNATLSNGVNVAAASTWVNWGNNGGNSSVTGTFGAVLDRNIGIETGGPTSANITLSNLGVGTQYQIQFFADSTGNNSQTISGSDPMNSLTGKFVTGAFTADATSQVLTVAYTVDFAVANALTIGVLPLTILYWDMNGTTAGAGGATPAGTWNAANTYWNAASDGTGTGTVVWAAGQRAVFAAGSDATGIYTVSVDGTHDISGLGFEEGTVTLDTATGGQLRLVKNADVDVASGLTATVRTSITEDATPRSLTKKGAGTLVLSGAGSYTGTTTVQNGTLRLGADNVLPNASAVTVRGDAAGVTAALDLAGYSDTIGSLTLGGSTPTSAAAVTTGVGTLTLGGNVAYDSTNKPLGATISGKVDLGAATRTVTVNDSATAANDLTVSAAISGTGAGLIKAGAGTLVLSGANTYTGGTNISVGALVLSGAGTLGDSANALTMSGGRLDLGTLSQTVGAVSITAAAGSADTIGNGSLTGTSYSASNASGNVIVSANLLGDAALAMSGAGTLTLSGTNAYTGTTTVSAGVLQAVTRAALPGYDSAGRVVFNGGTLLVALGGGWTIGDVSTILANATKTSGTLALDTSSGGATQTTAWDLGGLGLAKLGGNALTLNRANTITGTTTIGGGTLKLQNAGTGLTQTWGGLTLAGPDVTLQSDNAGTGTLSTTFGALTARNSGSTANIVSTGGTNGTDNLINLTGAAGFIDKGVFFGGANYAALDAANTYVRALAYGSDPDAEVVDTITTNKHVKLASSPAARVGDTLLSLNLAGGVNYTMSSGTLTVPGILKSGGGSSTISGGTAVTGGTGVELVIRTDASSDLLTVSTPVTGTGALTKSGAGTLTLSSSTNAYTGATAVNGGTLEIGSGGTLGSGTYTGAIAIADGATFKYNSSAGQTLSGAISGGGALTKTGGTLTLKGANSGFYGTVTVNSGNLILDSAAALGNASSLTIPGGIELQATGNVAAINTPITLAGPGTTIIHATTADASLAINAPISGSGNLKLQSARAAKSYFTLNAKSNYTGSTTLCGETPGSNVGWIYVALGIDDALPTGTVLTMSQNFAQLDLSGRNQTLGGLCDERLNVTGWNVLGWEVVNTSTTPAMLTVSGSSSNTFSGQLGTAAANGNFGLTKGGAGTFTLSSGAVVGGTNSGIHNYTGNTIVNGGMLEIGGAAKLGAGAYAGTISIASGGAFKYNSSAAQTLSGAISGSGRLIKDGAGTLTLTGAGTSGPTANVNGGTLTLDYSLADSSKLSDSSALVLGGGTLNLSGGTHAEVVASTTLSAGTSSVTRTSGSAVLQMGAISPAGGVVNFGAGSIATTTNSNDAGGILGAWATVGGTDWAANDGSGNIVAYTGAYTDIAATGDTITDGSATNVRLNIAGAGGNLALSAAATTVNTLLQNTAAASTIDTAGKTLATGGIRIGSGKEAVTVGASAGDGALTAATAGGVLVLNNGNAAKTLTVNAAIANNTSASALATAGNVLLKGVNTYTGATSVGATLEIGGAGQLGGGAYAGNISIAGGGTFKYTSSAAQTLSGDISIAGDATINNATALTASGAISGSGSLTKTGAGTLSLTNAASDYSGVTKIAAGTLEVSKLADAGLPSSIGLTGTDLVVGDGTTAPAAVCLRYVGAGDSTNTRFLFNGNPGTGLTVSVTLDASGAGPIKFTNTADFAHSPIQKPSTLILTGTNTDDNTLAANIEISYPANTDIIKNGTGTWVLTGASTGQYPNAGAVTVNDGTLKLANALTFRGNTVTMGGNSATLVFDSSVAGNAFTFDGLAASASGTGYDIALQNNAGTPAAIALTIGGYNSPSTTYAGVLGGSGSLIKVGGGTLTLLGANTYAGTTTVSAGTVVAGYPLPGYGDPARVSVAAGATLAAGAGGDGWTAGQLDALKDLGSASWAATSILGIDTTKGDFTYASAIGNAGANARNLKKLGANTLTLSGDLAHTGTTTVSGGTLALSGNNSSAAGATTVASGATLRVGAANNIPAGALTLAAGTLDLRADGSTTFGKNFTVSTGTTTINVDQAVGGSGTNGTHTMGTMSIGAQTLNATGGNGYRLALGAVTLTGNATMNPTTANLTVASITGATRSVTLSGTAADNAVTGNITTTTGTVTKSGAGTWTLSGANTYSGATTINAGGKLYVNGTHNPGSGNPTYSVLGTLGGSGTITTTADAVTVGSGGKLAPGTETAPGTLTMNLGAAALSLDAAKANNAGQFTFRLGTASDKIVFGAGSFLALGAATATNSSLDWSDFTFIPGTGLVEGVYTLIDAAANATGGLSTGAGLLTGAISTGTGTLSISGGQDLILTVTGLVKPGDTNGDRVVDAADFINLKKNFGKAGGIAQGDFNNSGTVNWADLSILMSNMGTGGDAPSVPEPATLGLLAIGALAMLRRRRA
jgi:autotransporter-associated beta strand protein